MDKKGGGGLAPVSFGYQKLKNTCPILTSCFINTLLRKTLGKCIQSDCVGFGGGQTASVARQLCMKASHVSNIYI